ncbi:uncharacterized protein [Cherax quadricarinatus]
MVNIAASKSEDLVATMDLVATTESKKMDVVSIAESKSKEAVTAGSESMEVVTTAGSESENLDTIDRSVSDELFTTYGQVRKMKVISDELQAGQMLPSLNEVTSRQSSQSVENNSALEEMSWMEQGRLYHHLIEAIYSASKAKNKRIYEENVAQLLSSKAPLVSPGSTYCSPLHLAITYNLLNILRRLLDNGASLTAKHFGLVPFQVAWRATGVTSEVSNYLTRVVEDKLINEKSLFTTDPVDSCLKKGIPHILKKIQGKTPWRAKFYYTEENFTLQQLLVRACAVGATMTAWFVLQAGGSTNTKDSSGTTALHAAVQAGKFDTARALVNDMKANLFLADDAGRRPIDILPPLERQLLMQNCVAREYRCLDNLQMKMKNKSQQEDLRNLILLFIVLFLIHEAKDPKLLWKPIFSCLVNDSRPYVSSSNHHDWLDNVARKLDTSYRRSYYEDIFVGFVDVLKKFFQSTKIERFSDQSFDHIDSLTRKALILCSEENFPVFMHLIVSVAYVDGNSEVNCVCQTKPLHHAAARNNMSAVTYLLSLGASCTVKDKCGNTPAHYAYMMGHRTMGEFLNVQEVQKEKNIMGRSPESVWEDFKTYMSQYKLNIEKCHTNKLQEQNTEEMLIKLHLEHLKEIWQSKGIRETVKEAHVNFTEGETREVKQAVQQLLTEIHNEVVKRNTLFEGELQLLGSSSDNVRLYCPDEYDVNITLKRISCLSDGDFSLKLEDSNEKYSLRNIIVSANNEGKKYLIHRSYIQDTFYDEVKQCLINMNFENKQLAPVLPGLKKTQVGVGLSLTWSGRQYPLLLVDIDIVLTIRAKWPDNLSKPKLLSPNINNVFLNSIGENEWRFSFAIAENHIMKTLPEDHRLVFLACKMVLASLKVEGWVPRQIKKQFTYWDARQFRIKPPGGFSLKNAFFLELEETKKNLSWRKKTLLEKIQSVFQRMCIQDNNTVRDGCIAAYFGGDTEKSPLCSGAAVIYSFLETFKEISKNNKESIKYEI